MPKIAEVDSAMAHALQGGVFEVHPELSFMAASGGYAIGDCQEALGWAAGA